MAKAKLVATRNITLVDPETNLPLEINEGDVILPDHQDLMTPEVLKAYSKPKTRTVVETETETEDDTEDEPDDGLNDLGVSALKKMMANAVPPVELPEGVSSSKSNIVAALREAGVTATEV